MRSEFCWQRLRTFQNRNRRSCHRILKTVSGTRYKLHGRRFERNLKNRRGKSADDCTRNFERRLREDGNRRRGKLNFKKIYSRTSQAIFESKLHFSHLKSKML